MYVYNKRLTDMTAKMIGKILIFSTKKKKFAIMHEERISEKPTGPHYISGESRGTSTEYVKAKYEY